ncbi:glutathione S-transferase family protein [Hyphobacterium marinum]|uniref:Glutathione S-transferase N-terminal domain-containing protein n=1 Tax=Hyphobacterium marinum TaxID=3116574 RepID=A0ABU7LZ35_9PROT|nr:glutathione S-transferase N-terminal domain-containing protein [Hyphobacterium sp. Y6023]MEE2566793.1 glutathione S-transferase N-terminal domain-containing protein [Hyphobacterium sp. Y6023]
MASSAPIELYYWPTPNGWKVSIALEEMGLPYEMRPVNIGIGEQFEPGFLKISPNNRMPAIIDPDGPDGQPVSVFESGAILQYLARKSGQFYGSNERERIAADEWLFWQMGGLGPMAGQAHHFRSYARKIEPDESKLEYGAARYTNEVNRLYGVLETRLALGHDYIAGPYSIADMAIWPWILPDGQGQDLNDFPHLKAWHERVGQRPAVQAGRAVGKELRGNLAADGKDAEAARKLLFGQRAR